MDDQPNTHCLNCGTELRGRFCSECGQKDLGTRVDLRELVGEFISETFEIEGRLPRTLFSVAFKPGMYLYRYLDGQRRSFSSPLRFYLLAVFLCVLVTGWRGERAVVAAMKSGDIVMEQSADGNNLSFSSNAEVFERRAAWEADIELQSALYAMRAPPTCDPEEKYLPLFSEACEPEVVDWLASLEPEPTLECMTVRDGVMEQMGATVVRLGRGRAPQEVAVILISAIVEQLPLALSAMMVLFTGLLKLLWWRHPTTVHVLTTVTFHALVLYGVTLWMLWPVSWLAWLVHGWLQAHALFSLKAAYDSSWPRTFLSYFVLGIAWVILLYGGMTLATVAAIWGLSGTV